MIFHSIIPAEVVFEKPCDAALAQTMEMNYQGERVVVSPLENNRYVIQRVISTSPRAYLNPKLSPGTIVSFSMVK